MSLFSVIASHNTLADAALKRPSPLINVQQLKRLMETENNWLLIDVRPRLQYLLGHIPGAHNVPPSAYAADEWEYPVKGMRASQTKMEQLLGRYGADLTTKIVLYNEDNNADAARLWWILTLYGHPNTLLLDGGVMAWKRAGLHASVKVPGSPEKSVYQFEANHAVPLLLADLEDVKSQLTNQNVVIVDVRPEAEASGKQRQSGALRKGRIPQSVWLDYSMIANDEGYLEKRYLEQQLTEKGVLPDKTIIIYCHSGVRSASAVFVLKELLGYPNVRNYDGSWIEWASIKELPVTKGPVK